MSGVPRGERVVLVRIPTTGPTAVDVRDPAALDDAVRRWWTVGDVRTVPGPAAPEHALAVAGGRVVAGFRLDGWERRRDGRRGFEGPRTDHLVGADVADLLPEDTPTPLRFVGCAPTASGDAPEQPPTGAPAARTGGTAGVAAEEVATEVDGLVRALEAEPLAHLVRGQREGVHAHLLAWCATTLPGVAERALGADLRPGPATGRSVVLDGRHLHLALPGRVRLVLETRVSTAPDVTELLATAAAEAGGEPARLVLLSATPLDGDPSWTPEGLHHGHPDLTPWAPLSLGGLADRLDAALDGERESYEVETVRRHARLLRLLHRLHRATRLRGPDEVAELPAAVLARVPDPQLVRALQRSRARQVALHVETALRRRGVEGRSSSGCSFGVQLVDWRHDRIDRDGRVVEVGWQLQGRALRRFVTTAHLAGTAPHALAARFAHAAAHPQWFDFAPLDPVLGTATTPTTPAVTAAKPHGFNQFAPDLVHRSKNVSDVTVAQLVAVGEAVAREAGA